MDKKAIFWSVEIALFVPSNLAMSYLKMAAAFSIFHFLFQMMSPDGMNSFDLAISIVISMTLL
jgi:hypothetical protein